MGWWGHQPLSGDTPLDLLSWVPDVFGIDADLDGIYPDGTLDEGTRQVVAARLRQMTDEQVDEAVSVLLRRFTGGHSPWGEDKQVAWQVVAVLWMGSGAPLPEATRARMRAAADQDPWAREDSSRRAAMDQLVAAVDGYSGGGPVPVASRTLGDALNAAQQAGHVGLLNVGPETHGC